MLTGKREALNRCRYWRLTFLSSAVQDHLSDNAADGLRLPWGKGDLRVLNCITSTSGQKTFFCVNVILFVIMNTN